MITITLVGPMDCPNCEKVKESIEGLRQSYPQIKINQIDAYSPEGEELVLEHGILASPGILVDGTYVGSGNFPLAKIEAHIANSATSTGQSSSSSCH